MLFKNKAAIVTGGSCGIGFATVNKFLAEGDSVILCGSQQSGAEEAVAKIKAESLQAWSRGSRRISSSFESRIYRAALYTFELVFK